MSTVSKRPTLGRRQFLQTAAAGTVLALGFDKLGEVVLAQNPPQNIGPKVFNVWLEIGKDNVVTFYSPEVEYGQGTNTALAMLIAEELDLDWSKLKVVQSGSDEVYANPLSHHVATNSSAGVRFRFDQMRKIGASAREMLKAAAAAQWKVPVGELTTAKSMVSHAASKKSASYGSLSAAASAMPLPENIALRPAEQWKIIGTSMPRLDIELKCTGRAKYNIDLRMPGLLHAAVVRSPVRGSKVKSIDSSAVKKTKELKSIENLGYGVAVVATDPWTARNALSQVKITWEANEYDNLTSESLSKSYSDALANKPGTVAKNEGDFDAASKAPGAKIIEAEYTVPYLHHMCMEPMGSTAHVHDGMCELWAPTNSATGLVNGIAFLLNIPPEKVIVRRSEFIGGSFGRRDRLDQDMEAVQLSQRMKAPVQVIQSREHDLQMGYYRPYQKTRMRAVIDANGAITGWHHKIAGQAIAHSGHDLSELAWAGVDMAKLEPYLKAGGSPFYTMPFDFFSVSNTPFNWAYTAPNIHVEVVEMESPLKPTYWRSVGTSGNIFQIEGFLDEVGAAANADPFEFRKKLLMPKHPRAVAILDELAKAIDWKGPQKPGSGSGWGIGFMFGFNAYGAIAVQVEAAGKKLNIKRVVAVIDQGVTVNQDQTEAQWQGGIVDGLAATCLQEVTIKNGAVVQSNWGDYPTLTLRNVPSIELKVMPSRDAPGAISELATPLVMASVANAVFAATGTRVRELPLTKSGFSI